MQLPSENYCAQISLYVAERNWPGLLSYDDEDDQLSENYQKQLTQYGEQVRRGDET